MSVRQQADNTDQSRALSNKRREHCVSRVPYNRYVLAEVARALHPNRGRIRERALRVYLCVCMRAYVLVDRCEFIGVCVCVCVCVCAAFFNQAHIKLLCV